MRTRFLKYPLIFLATYLKEPWTEIWRFFEICIKLWLLKMFFKILKALDFSSFNFSISHTLWLYIYIEPKMENKSKKRLALSTAGVVGDVPPLPLPPRLFSSWSPPPPPPPADAAAAASAAVGSQKKKKKKLHLSLVECTKDVHHHTSLLFFWSYLWCS